MATLRVPEDLMRQVAQQARPGETASEAARRLFETALAPLWAVWTVDEAAAAWGLHPAYVRKLAARGAFPARHLGGAWILPRGTPAPVCGPGPARGRSKED